MRHVWFWNWRNRAFRTFGCDYFKSFTKKCFSSSKFLFEVDTIAFEETCWRRFLDCILDVCLQPTAEDFIKRKFDRQYLPKLTHGQRVSTFFVVFFSQKYHSFVCLFFTSLFFCWTMFCELMAAVQRKNVVVYWVTGTLWSVTLFKITISWHFQDTEKFSDSFPKK